MAKDTSKIMEEINRMKDVAEIKSFNANHREDMQFPNPMDYLLECLDRHGKKKSNLTTSNALESSFANKLIAGTRKFNRNHLLIFAFLGGLSLEETQNLLKYGKQTQLYPKVQRDSVVIFGLLNQYKLQDVDAVLNDMGLEVLGRY